MVLWASWLGAGLSPGFAQTGLTVITHPTPEQLEAGFKGWAEERPGSFEFESRGVTPEGRPILMGKITDSSVPAEDKQVALFTSCHVAKELNAGTGLLRLMKWLLSDDAEAAEIRRRQIVLVVPYTDPDHIALGKLIKTRRIYAGRTPSGEQLWSVAGVAQPELHPEAVALQGIIDEYRPELFIDYHGFNHAERTMWDSTGISWGAPVSRAFLRDFPERMADAAEREGFLITRGEYDDGKILTTSPVPGYPDYLFYLRNPGTNITTYAYARYHTLSFIMESGSEESLLAQTKHALLLGHERGRYERFAGYPVNQVGNWTLVSLSAYGRTAAERRKSRTELWQKLPNLQYGTASPAPARDTLMAYVTTNHEARRHVEGQVLEAVARLADNPRFDHDGLMAAARRFPYGGFGGPRPHYKPDYGAVAAGPIEHGLVVRLLIPYLDATLTEVRLDGHLIPAADEGGYSLTRGPGTIVEIPIAPDRVRDIHFVSCTYETPSVRRPGFTPEDW